MPLLQAVMKVSFFCAFMSAIWPTPEHCQETLRFHPIAFFLWRVAEKDDVIPLENPIVTETGETISEIPIAAGQVILPSICSYNRSVATYLSVGLVLFYHFRASGLQTSGVKTRMSGIPCASSSRISRSRRRSECSRMCKQGVFMLHPNLR